MSGDDALSAWFASLTALDLLGFVGVALYIGAYLSLQLGFLKGDGFLYPALNLCASLSVLASLTANFNPYSATIEISWSLISIVGLTRLYFVHHHIRLGSDETAVAGRLVPGLKKDRARQFIRHGRFVDAGPGTVIAAEGQPIKDLAMVLSGQCSVERGGVPVARIGAGALVGELTFATGAAATATVTVVAPARLFLIEREDLQVYLHRNPEIAAEIEQSIAGDLRAKLTDTTARLSQSLVGRTD